MSQSRELMMSHSDINASARIQAQLNASTQDSPIGPMLFVGNLSYRTKTKDLLQFFKKSAADIDINLALDYNCEFRGFGNVKFPTEADAQKALELNGQTLLGNKVIVAPVCRPVSRDWHIHVKGFGKSLKAYEIERSVKHHFESCGEIIDVRMLEDDTGAFGGSVIAEFLKLGCVSCALKLDGSNLLGCQISVREFCLNDS